MLTKLFWSLSALLTSLIALWGSLRLGWTWETVFPAAFTLGFFCLAFATGTRKVPAAAPEPRPAARKPPAPLRTVPRYQPHAPPSAPDTIPPAGEARFEWTATPAASDSHGPTSS